MLEINVTLLIQIVHFYIAYRIIRTFLLEPVYASIIKEEAQTESLQQGIGMQKEYIYQIRLAMYEQWVSCQDFFKKRSPDLSQSQLYVFRNIVPSRQRPIVEDKEIAQKVIELSQAITKEINHVRL